MAGLLVLILATNYTNLLTYNVGQARCQTSSDINIATNIIALLMRVYVPFALMVIFNGFVIKRLRKSKIKVGAIATQIGQKKKQRGQMSQKEYKFIVSTIIMDFIFFAFYTPLAVYLIMSIVDLFSGALSSNPLTSQITSFYSNIVQLLAYSYHTVVIFIFSGFNKFFRIEIRKLLCLQRCYPVVTETTAALNNTNNTK